MACFETGVVSHSSLGLEKQIRPGWGPAGGWEAGGEEHRRWTQLDSHSQGPHILTTARRVPIVTGADLRQGGGNTPPELIDMHIFSSLVIVAAANQLVMFSEKENQEWRAKSRFLAPKLTVTLCDYFVACALILPKEWDRYGKG